jgi:hypothetical protein
MGELAEIVGADEDILWQGRPALLPFFATTLLSLLVGIPLLSLVFLPATTTGTPVMTGYLLLAPFLLLGLTFAVAFPLYRILRYLHTRYAITDKRVVLESGIIERESEMVDFDQIAGASVEVSLTDIFLGLGRTGSIALVLRGASDVEQDKDTSTPYILSHIAHPYTVFAFFHRAEFDVKTDMEYPNTLRPPANPGYDTHYPPPAQS